MTTDQRLANARGRLSGWRAATVWLVIGTVLTALVVSLILTSLSEGVPDSGLLIFSSIAASLGVVGSLVVTRQPRNAIGWILWLSSIAVGASTVASAYLSAALAGDGPVSPGIALVAWATGVMLTPAITGILVFIPLLFPDGRYLTRRWRWVGMYGVLVIGLVLIGNLFRPGPLDDYPTVDNPVGLQAFALLAEPVEFAKGPGVLIAAILAVASAFVRYRRASFVQRAQLRWYGAAAGLTISLFTLSIAGTALNLLELADFGWTAGIISLSLVPIAIGIAILRYRLYEIDRLVSRTIGWALVTGLLVAVFALLVVVLQALLAPLTRESTLAVAASTLVAFALFQPLRRRIQLTVDRRFDRAWYDGQRMTDAFAEHLRSEVDLVTIRASLASTANEAVRPSGSSVWLRGPVG